MLRIGLISEHRTKPRRFLWGKYTTDILKYSQNPFELVVVTVPFSECMFEKLKKKKKGRIVERAQRCLERNGVDRIVLSTFMKTQMTDSMLTKKCDCQKRRLFSEWAYPCVKRMSAKCGINLMNAGICIRKARWGTDCEGIFEKLQYDTRRLAFCTRELQKGRMVCEKVSEDTGMPIKVVEYEAATEFDVVVDMDECWVRIGRDLIIDGAALEYNLGDFSADMTDISGVMCDFVTFEGKILLFSGKKKLTL